MLRAPACPNSAHLPRTKSWAHTHLVCTSEMRQKVSRGSSLYHSGAGAHVWFTSCLCSKWTVTLLTSGPLLDVLLWSLDRPPAASLHLSSHLSFRLCEQSPAPSLFLARSSLLPFTPFTLFLHIFLPLMLPLSTILSLFFPSCHSPSGSVSTSLRHPLPPSPVQWPDVANWKHVSHPAANYRATAATDVLKDVLGVTKVKRKRRHPWVYWRIHMPQTLLPD